MIPILDNLRSSHLSRHQKTRLGSTGLASSRDPKEVSHIFGKALAPKGTRVFNPAFDVTSQDLITAIITEKGVITPPYQQNIRNHVDH